MKNRLQIDNMPLPPDPSGVEDPLALLRQLQAQHDYLLAMQADIKQLRDLLDASSAS